MKRAIDLTPAHAAGTALTAYAQGTAIGSWCCGPGATSPIPPKFLPGSCRG